MEAHVDETKMNEIILPSVTYDFAERTGNTPKEYRFYIVTLKDNYITYKWNVYPKGLDENIVFIWKCYNEYGIVLKCNDAVVEIENNYTGQVNYYPTCEQHTFEYLTKYHNKPPTLYSQALKICRINQIRTEVKSTKFRNVNQTKRINSDLSDNNKFHCISCVINDHLPPKKLRPHIKLPISGRHEPYFPLALCEEDDWM